MPSVSTVIAVMAVLCFTATVVGVHLFRRFAVARGHFDIPNERSSHTTPTPRGGGLVMALVVLIAFVAASFGLGIRVPLGYLAGAVIIVAVSWLDDVRSIAFHWRLLVHALAAMLLIADTGYFENIYVPYAGSTLELGTFGAVLSAVGIVWLINAYNFMDGIDGIAGGQGISGALGWLLIALHFQSNSVALLSAALLAATFGFLIHNWPPAKIFMGDAGSAFLGFTFAAMPFVARETDAESKLTLPWIATLLIWLFVFDSVLTVFRRIVRKEKIWQPHRSHLYQRMVINGMSHRLVTVVYLILSLGVMVATYLSATAVWTYEMAAVPFAIAAAILLIGAFMLSRQKAAR